jgi:hypothetical protein
MYYCLIKTEVNFGKAIAHLERAIKLDGNISSYYITKGLLEYENCDLDSCITSFALAKGINVKNEEGQKSEILKKFLNDILRNKK